jgi:hypothetical protein
MMNNSIKDQAFPDENNYGISIRDYFAAKALQGVMACNGIYEDEKKLAQWCYEQADAMLEVREKK